MDLEPIIRYLDEENHLEKEFNNQRQKHLNLIDLLANTTTFTLSIKQSQNSNNLKHSITCNLCPELCGFASNSEYLSHAWKRHLILKNSVNNNNNISSSSSSHSHTCWTCATSKCAASSFLFKTNELLVTHFQQAHLLEECHKLPM